MSGWEPGASAARRALFEHYRDGAESVWVQATGWSMTPLVSPGSWLLVDFGSQPRRPGEIVVFTQGDDIVSHRVLWRRRGGGLVTKGDATTWLDPPVAPAAVLGVVRALRQHPEAVPARGGCSGPRAWTLAVVSGASATAMSCARRLPAGPRRPLSAFIERAAGSVCARIAGA